MGAFLSLDPLHQVLYIQFEGTVTDDVLLSRFQEVREWMDRNGQFSSITDFSPVTRFEVTSQGVDRLASNPPLVPDNLLRIVVAPQDETFGMARMFEMLGSATRNKVYVVRTMAEAHRVLGMGPLHFGPAI